ncbi:MAG: hypothetical protein V3T49_01925 [Dehalococcoidia bacterium]
MLVAIVIGGAGASAVLGLEGAMVASLLTLGFTLTLFGWAYRRQRSISP